MSSDPLSPLSVRRFTVHVPQLVGRVSYPQVSEATPQGVHQAMRRLVGELDTAMTELQNYLKYLQYSSDKMVDQTSLETVLLTPVFPGLVFVNATPVYNVQPGDFILLVDASGGDVAIVLPLASALAGRWLEVKKIDATDNRVTFVTAGGDVMDGFPTQELLFEDEAVPIVSDGMSEWHVL